MLETAFSLWAAPVTYLEIVAFVLSLACIVCNVRELHWGWPLAIISSALYCWLFMASKLYGDGALQIFFALTALWGWWQWLYGTRSVATTSANTPLTIARLPRGRFLHVALAWAIGWGVIGLFLAKFTDTDVPWFDAFPTAGGLIGQVLLARKYIENWPVWVVANVVSVALFAYKQLYLTALLYAIFVALAAWGWQRWRAQLPKLAQP